MTWSWKFTDVDGQEWNGDEISRQDFPSQSDAESWLGETWRDLREHGIAGVTLCEEAREVYGPMPLEG